MLFIKSHEKKKKKAINNLFLSSHLQPHIYDHQQSKLQKSTMIIYIYMYVYFCLNLQKLNFYYPQQANKT